MSRNKNLQDALYQLEIAALAKLQARIDSGDPLTSEELLSIVSKAHDARLVQEWTARLVRAIRSNPSLLSHPGAKNGLGKLQTLAGRTIKAMKRDGRTSAEKVKHESRVSLAGVPGVDFPSDEA